MNKAEINKQLRATQVEIVLNAHRNTAARAGFTASSFAGDGATAQVHRNELHALLDAELDATSAIYALSKKLMEVDE